MPQLCITVSEETREKLDNLVIDQDRSISWIVRKAIEEYIKMNEAKND